MQLDLDESEKNNSEKTIRIDKWLWAARFFKTKVLAAEAVANGKVLLNGERIRPAKILQYNDQIRIKYGLYEYTVVVRGLSRRRGPPSETDYLYQETEESKRNREALTVQLKENALNVPFQKDYSV